MQYNNLYCIKLCKNITYFCTQKTIPPKPNQDHLPNCMVVVGRLFFIFIYLVFPLAQLAGEELAFLCGGCQAYQTIPLTTFHKQE